MTIEFRCYDALVRRNHRNRVFQMTVRSFRFGKNNGATALRVHRRGNRFELTLVRSTVSLSDQFPIAVRIKTISSNLYTARKKLKFGPEASTGRLKVNERRPQLLLTRAIFNGHGRLQIMQSRNINRKCQKHGNLSEFNTSVKKLGNF